MKRLSTVLLCIASLASSWTASAATVWYPTGGDVDTITLSFIGPLPANSAFGLFDDTTTVNGASAPDLQIANSDQLVFTQDGGGIWSVASTVLGGSFVIGASNWFQFGFSADTSASNNWQGDSSLSQVGVDSWLIGFPSLPAGVTFVAADLLPVPLPAGAPLFISGALALMVFIAPRRTNRNARRG